MSQEPKHSINVSTTIHAPLDVVWDAWTQPEHITHWNFASDDWCCPSAINDVQPGGIFKWRMEAKDGSFGFDFEGSYQTVRQSEYLEYAIGDGRRVSVTFGTTADGTTVSETFEAESVNSPELQQRGWQSILDNFKKYAESIAV